MWAFIKGLVTALPLIAGLVEKALEAYKAYKQKKLEQEYADKDKIRAEILALISKAKTDEERSALLSRLANLNGVPK